MTLLAVYFALMFLLHESLQPDQLFLIFTIATVVVMGGKVGRRFVIDWAPFTLFIIIYDGMRGIADNVAAHVNVMAPYRLETALTGWLTKGEGIPFLLQHWRSSMHSILTVRVMDCMGGLLYSFHFVAPFIFAWLLWHTYQDRREFYAFTYSLTILNMMALATFFLYPSAPPWYVWKYHFARPNLAAFNGGNPSVLIHVDNLLNFPLFSSVYGALNPNAFAAIPSLHGSYPLMIACFAFRRWRSLLIRATFVLYVGATWFAACYLNHHYLVDLLIGVAYVAISLFLYRHVVGPFVIEPLVFGRQGNTFLSPQTEEGRMRNPRLATILFGSFGVVLIILMLARANGFLSFGRRGVF